MKKRLQKAFTIVELVIVIAVIAILAAVLIPTFVSLVNRANTSADEQAVTNMNKVLAAECIDSTPEHVSEVRTILQENGFKNFVSNISGRYFGWLQDENVVIVYAFDEDNAPYVVFPAQYANVALSNNYFNLQFLAAASELEFTQAIAEAQPYDTVTIANDISTDYLYIDKPVSIDLGGNALQLGCNEWCSVDIWMEGEEVVPVTIRNGTVRDIAAAGERSDEFNAMFYIEAPIELHLDDVTIQANQGNYAMCCNSLESIDIKNTTVQGMCLFVDVGKTTIESTASFQGNAGDPHVILWQ